jgi:hypothetical protein
VKQSLWLVLIGALLLAGAYALGRYTQERLTDAKLRTALDSAAAEHGRILAADSAYERATDSMHMTVAKLDSLRRIVATKVGLADSLHRTETALRAQADTTHDLGQRVTLLEAALGQADSVERSLRDALHAQMLHSVELAADADRWHTQAVSWRAHALAADAINAEVARRVREMSSCGFPWNVAGCPDRGVVGAVALVVGAVAGVVLTVAAGG